jgi:hypothetical protein
MSLLNIFKNKKKTNEEIERDNNQIIKDFVKGGINMAEEDFDEGDEEFEDDEEVIEAPKKKVAPVQPARPIGRPRIDTRPQPQVKAKVQTAIENPTVKLQVNQVTGYQFEFPDGTTGDIYDMLVRLSNKMDAIEKAVGA